MREAEAEGGSCSPAPQRPGTPKLQEAKRSLELGGKEAPPTPRLGLSVRGGGTFPLLPVPWPVAALRAATGRAQPVRAVVAQSPERR